MVVEDEWLSSDSRSTLHDGIVFEDILNSDDESDDNNNETIANPLSSVAQGIGSITLKNSGKNSMSLLALGNNPIIQKLANNYVICILIVR